MTKVAPSGLLAGQDQRKKMRKRTDVIATRLPVC